GTGQEEGVGAGGRLTAAYERAMGVILLQGVEQNKNIIANRPHARGAVRGGARMALRRRGGGASGPFELGSGAPRVPFPSARPGDTLRGRGGGAFKNS